MAIYVPQISGYEPFYIQRDGDASATNILSAYGVIIKDSGYPMNRKAKAPYNNDWKDRSGDDEWNRVINYEAFNYTFVCALFARNVNGDSAARQELKDGIRAFQNFIKNGEFKFYSAYTKFGFQRVRIEEFHDPGEAGFRTFGDAARVIFSFTVKVNDPVTDMVLSNNQIVEA